LWARHPLSPFRLAVPWPGTPFPPQGRSGGCPCLCGTTRRSDAPSPVPLRAARRSARRYRSCRRGGDGASQVPGGPSCWRRVLGPRWDLRCWPDGPSPGELLFPARLSPHRCLIPPVPSSHPRCCLRRIKPSRLPRLCLSGLCRTAPALAVYASPRPSPGRHARLASGWWPTFPRRDFNPQGP